MGWWQDNVGCYEPDGAECDKCSLKFKCEWEKWRCKSGNHCKGDDAWCTQPGCNWDCRKSECLEAECDCEGSNYNSDSDCASETESETNESVTKESDCSECDSKPEFCVCDDEYCQDNEHCRINKRHSVCCIADTTELPRDERRDYILKRNSAQVIFLLGNVNFF